MCGVVVVGKEVQEVVQALLSLASPLLSLSYQHEENNVYFTKYIVKVSKLGAGVALCISRTTGS